MAKTHVIDGKTYVEVPRQAKIGEKVIITADGLLLGENHFGKIYTVTEHDGGLVNTDGFWNDGSTLNLRDDEYRVLAPVATEEPIEDCAMLTETDVRKQPGKVIDLLANLARRVSSLEAQLKDTQHNVERQGVEIAELKHLAESNEEDIRTLDERTQPKTYVADAFPSNAKLLADAFAALAKYENGGAR